MTTHIGTGHALAEKQWRPALCHQAERQAHMLTFVGSKEDSVINQMDELSRKRGDTVQVRFSPTDDTTDGFGESDTIQGNEQGITLDSDELKINWLGNAFAQSSQMSQQRVSFDLKKAAFYKLSAWWARRWEESILNQLAGNVSVNTGIYKRGGMNAVPTVDSNHHFIQSGVASYATDEALSAATDTTAVFNLNILNTMVLRAMSQSYLTYPISVANDGFYHCVIHPEQWAQLRTDTSTGEWQDIDLTRIKGGEGYASSGLARGMLGIYGNVKIHVSDWVPKGCNSTTGAAVNNVRRAVFLGAKAAHMAYGEGYAKGQHLDWVERINDYRKWGVLADSVFGIKTTVFNGEYYGSMVISTYSAT